MAIIPCWVSIPMFMMTRNRLKEVSVSDQTIRCATFCHFLSHRVEPKIIEIQIYGYHTLLGLNSYVSDDDKSIRSCLKFIRPSGVPLLPLFATIGATAERKIIEILIHDYHTLLGANSYVFDDDKSIKSGCKIIK